MIVKNSVTTKAYMHEPFTDFTLAENRREFQKALEAVQMERGKEYPLVIGRERIITDEKICIH